MLFGRFRKKPRPKQKCVLVVDDVSTIRAISGSVFTEAGHRVVEARNGFEALELAGKHHPSLIVTDIIMQGQKQGLELLDKLREDKDLKSIPVVVLASDIDTESTASMVPEQVIDCIAKDNLATVLQSLRKHLEILECG